jgi:hypothetical protein
MGFTRVWTWYLARTPVIVAVYRALGADIFEKVNLDDAVIEDPDLVKIGSQASLQPLSALIPGEVFGEFLVLRPLAVGSHAKLQPRGSVLGGGVVGPGAIVRPGAAVTPATLFSDDGVGVGSVLEGCPAMPRGSGSCKPIWHPRWFGSWAFLLGQLVAVYVIIGVNVAAFGLSVFVVRVSIVRLVLEIACLLVFLA